MNFDYEFQTIMVESEAVESGAVETFVSTDKLITSNYNHRPNVIDWDLVKKLADTIIKNKDNPTPVGRIWCRRSVKNPGYLEICCGQHRTAAYKAAGISLIPVLILKLTDVEMVEMSHDENNNRACASPVDNDRSAHMAWSLGRTIEEITKRFKYINTTNASNAVKRSAFLSEEIKEEYRKEVSGSKKAATISNKFTELTKIKKEHQVYIYSEYKKNGSKFTNAEFKDYIVNCLKINKNNNNNIGQSNNISYAKHINLQESVEPKTITTTEELVQDITITTTKELVQDITITTTKELVKPKAITTKEEKYIAEFSKTELILLKSMLAEAENRNGLGELVNAVYKAQLQSK